MNIREFEGRSPTLGARVYIDPTALLIGDVVLGEDSSVWPMAVIRGDVHSVRIGARTSIQDGCILHVSHRSAFNPAGFPLDIGDDVTVGHRAVLHGCHIGAQVLIGIGATVLDGAVVPPQVLLGANALVTPGQILESGFLYIGQPARKARPLTAEELERLAYSAAHYVRLKDRSIAVATPAVPLP